MRQSSSPINTWQNSAFPFTIALMAIAFATLMLSLFLRDAIYLLAFASPTHILQPWRMVTYPFVPGGDFLSFLFHIGLMYWLFGSLERSWGTRNFAIFWFGATVSGILLLALGGYLLQVPPMGLYWIPLAAGAVAWGLLNAEEAITFWFIPMKGLYIAFIGILILVVDYGRLSPGLIPFCLGSCAFAYLWVQKRSWAYSGYAGASSARAPRLRLVKGNTKPADDRFSLRSLNPLEWLGRQRRRRKFERLMKDD